MPKLASGLAAIILSALAVLLSSVALLIAMGMLDVGKPVSSDFGAQTQRYLLDNPEVVVEALQQLEQRRQAEEMNELKAVVSERRDEIFTDPTAPVGGNPEGDVTLVEFFDYNCPYCRKAAPEVRQALSDDPGLRLVYKEWPILGPDSEFAAKAALAAHRQGKYEAFHHALMSLSGSVTERSTLSVAEEVGLDLQRLKEDVNDPEITAAIERNRALANDLRITGTPTFVVGDEIIRGLVDLATLNSFIAEARKAPEE